VPQRLLRVTVRIAASPPAPGRIRFSPSCADAAVGAQNEESGRGRRGSPNLLNTSGVE